MSLSITQAHRTDAARNVAGRREHFASRRTIAAMLDESDRQAAVARLDASVDAPRIAVQVRHACEGHAEGAVLRDRRHAPAPLGQKLLQLSNAVVSLIRHPYLFDRNWLGRTIPRNELPLYPRLKPAGRRIEYKGPLLSALCLDSRNGHSIKDPLIFIVQSCRDDNLITFDSNILKFVVVFNFIRRRFQYIF